MTQQDRVKAVLESTRERLTLHQIKRRIRAEFGKSDAETAISARVRDIRNDLKLTGKTILSERVSPEKRHHAYWIADLPGSLSCVS